MSLLVMAVVTAGFLGVAGNALAADKLECAVMKEGKKTTQVVESKDACTKLHGTIVKPKSAAMPATSKPSTK